MDGDPLGAFRSPLVLIEPNLVITGIFGSFASWLACKLAGVDPFSSLLLREKPDWWVVGIWAVVGLVVVTFVGLWIEGVAGLIERYATTESSEDGEHDRSRRQWYVNCVGPQPDYVAAQRWMWQSEQAAAEFTRRRLRILISRNAVIVALLFIFLSVIVQACATSCDYCAILWCVLGGLVIAATFAWCWISAQQGYDAAVRNAALLNS